VAELVQYRSEVQRLSTEIATFTKRDTTTTNVFVDNLLSNAETMMGLFTRGVATVATADVDEGDVVGDNGGN
jgi:hypothetical protein